MPVTKIILSIALCLTLAACGRPVESEAPSAQPAAPSPPSNPVADALIGSAQRALERRYPRDAVLLVDQAISDASRSTQVCGRFILVTKNKRRDRFFVVSTVELIEMKSREDRRWRAACSDARPMPGAADSTEVEAQVAALAQRQAMVSP